MRKQGLRGVKCFVQGHSATHIPEQSEGKGLSLSEKDEEKDQVYPGLTSLTISRTKEPLKMRRTGLPLGVPGGFSGKGKLPCTEITLKPSFLGQFFFFFHSFYFIFFCLLSSLRIPDLIRSCSGLSQPRAMVSITVILMTLQEHPKRINLFVLH